MKNNPLIQAWLVLVLALGFGAALAGVQVWLGPRIEENKRNETYDQIPKLVPGADKAGTREVTVTVGSQERVVYQAVAADGAHVGWVVRASGMGFADRIELLIGLDARAETLTGLYVLENKETPALGNKIKEAGFRGRFAGKATGRPLAVTKGKDPAAHEIQAITSATVSSEAVTQIVNAAVAEYKAALAEGVR